MTSKQIEPSVAISTSPQLKRKLKLPNFWKTLAVVLLVALALSLWLWKPWQANIKASDRTVAVTGTATIKAVPDEFIFSPSYTFTNADKQAALAQMTKKSDEIISKIKALGVASNKIKSDSNNYSDLYSVDSTGASTYNLMLTVTVDNKLAQKVQDYLLTTTPSGSITPQYSFSTTMQKILENQARDKAEQDARSRAEQSAKNLGFKVAAVKSVEDGSLSGGGCGFLCYGANASTTLQAADTSSSRSLTLQPGENELPYSVKVTFYIH